MFKRKLAALNFHSPNEFNCDNEVEFRNFISWLENQKIRLYKIEDRAILDQIDSANWQSAFDKYLNELNCSANRSNRIELIDWLLATAIKYEFEDNPEKYNKVRDKSFQNESKKASDNVLENLDYTSTEFKDGLNKIRSLLNIPPKQDDPKTVLLAVSKLVCDKLNFDAIKTAQNSSNSKDQIPPLSLQTMPLGFDTNDYIINEAAKILRLLHINDLRNLQTKINEAIVSIQSITANPKTDSSLGKVGF